MEGPGDPEVPSDAVAMTQEFLEGLLLVGGDLGGPPRSLGVMHQAVDAIGVKAFDPTRQGGAVDVCDRQS